MKYLAVMGLIPTCAFAFTVQCFDVTNSAMELTIGLDDNGAVTQLALADLNPKSPIAGTLQTVTLDTHRDLRVSSLPDGALIPLNSRVQARRDPATGEFQELGLITDSGVPTTYASCK